MNTAASTKAAAQVPLQGLVRITGALLDDARITLATGRPPHALLQLHFAQPGSGLPYLARIDLGADPADHMAAQALLVQMRSGTWVSVAADALQLQADHGAHALRLVNPRDAIALGQPREAAACSATTTTATATANAER